MYYTLQRRRDIEKDYKIPPGTALSLSPAVSSGTSLSLSSTLLYNFTLINRYSN